VAKREKQKIIDDKRKAAAEKAAGKGKSKGKNKGKNKGKKNNNQLAIEVPGEAIDSLFREDYEDNEIKAQLAAELEATTLNAATTTTRSSRTRRAPVRYRQ
jgi:hypothetical protein